MIKMHDVILDELRAEHQISDEFGVFWNCDLQCVLYRPDARECMHRGADAAYAFNKCPSVARIASFQDRFNTAHHRSGTEGISDFAAFDHGFDPKVALDSCNGVNNYSCHDASPPLFGSADRSIGSGRFGLTDSSMFSCITLRLRM